MADEAYGQVGEKRQDAASTLGAGSAACGVSWTWVVVLLMAGVCACSPPEGPFPITEIRPRTPSEAPPGPVSSAQRFGYEPLPNEAAALSDTSAIRWDTPPGWRAEPGSGVHLAAFSMEAHPSVRCTISVLSGSAGGITANVNRWRNQMDHPPLSEDEVRGLPTVTVLGHSAPFVEVSGSYSSGDGPPQPGYLLLGTMSERESQSVFLKLVGPEADVRAEAPGFRALCESLR